MQTHNTRLCWNKELIACDEHKRPKHGAEIKKLNILLLGVLLKPFLKVGMHFLGCSCPIRSIQYVYCYYTGVDYFSRTACHEVYYSTADCQGLRFPIYLLLNQQLLTDQNPEFSNETVYLETNPSVSGHFIASSMIKPNETDG